jgi:hypothetical protein
MTKEVVVYMMTTTPSLLYEISEAMMNVIWKK